MMMRRGFCCALIGALALSHTASAQRRIVAVRGVVFDSLRGEPLKNAFVTMAGGRAISTDDRGRFRFDSISPGAYTFTVHHAVLDSIGFAGLSRQATITDGEDEIRLTVPSFATLWRVACGRRPAPRDSGIVYGTIRDADRGAPVADASVVLGWRDLLLDKKTHRVVDRHYRIETRSNPTGGYAICGVATDIGLHVRASTDSSASDAIQMLPVGVRVQRRDLAVGPITGDPARRGAISGVVTDFAGQPIGDARVVLDSLPETHTDTAGRFTLSSVPIGTRQLEVTAIGSEPAMPVVDVTQGETTSTVVQLRKILELTGMRTTASAGARTFASEFTERRKTGFGYTLDSTQIMRYSQFVNVLQSVPSLNVQVHSSTLSITVPDGRGGVCAPDVLIDGALAMFGHLLDLYPREVAAMEVYPTSSHIPSKYARIGIQSQCGMILVWTKYGFSNR